MSKQWTLTLRDYAQPDDEMPEHTDLATCHCSAHMLQAIADREDIAYMCYVTEWDYGDNPEGEILEQTNAQEWVEQELSQYA